MKSISTPNFIDTSSTKSICLIVGLTCLAGFGLDFLALALPPNLLELQWRLTLLQQTGDRSIILLFGAALTLYAVLGNRRLLKQLAFGCLIAGIIFHLSCILLIQDSITLKNQAVRNISDQVAQVQTRAQEAQENPDLASNVTPEQIEQAYQQIVTQAESLKQNTQLSITKAAIVSLGNLLIVGLGLISLGRFGLKRA